MSEARPDCEMCGQPYHRYSPDDPEHEYSAVACINSLRGRVDELEALLLEARAYVPQRGPDSGYTDAGLRERIDAEIGP